MKHKQSSLSISPKLAQFAYISLFIILSFLFFFFTPYLNYDNYFPTKKKKEKKRKSLTLKEQVYNSYTNYFSQSYFIHTVQYRQPTCVTGILDYVLSVQSLKGISKSSLKSFCLNLYSTFDRVCCVKKNITLLKKYLIIPINDKFAFLGLLHDQI